jgi:hypothetical protein
MKNVHCLIVEEIFKSEFICCLLFQKEQKERNRKRKNGKQINLTSFYLREHATLDEYLAKIYNFQLCQKKNIVAGGKLSHLTCNYSKMV